MNSKHKRSASKIPANDNQKYLSRLRRIYASVPVKPDVFGRRRASPCEIEQALSSAQLGESRKIFKKSFRIP